MTFLIGNGEKAILDRYCIYTIAQDMIARTCLLEVIQLDV
jgi:hypothetical protein